MHSRPEIPQLVPLRKNFLRAQVFFAAMKAMFLSGRLQAGASANRQQKEIWFPKLGSGDTAAGE
jgi:hypothetical protein